MKRHNIDVDTHIQGWYIPKKICDDLIKFFKSKKNRQYEGKTAVGLNKDVKESIDINLAYSDSALDEYNVYLRKCVSNYVEIYDYVKTLGKIENNREEYNIQYYKPGGGFKKWHSENNNHYIFRDRVLVFMTYLNDVPKGGTEFLYQKYTSPAKKGLTLIWPAQFTHLHRGQIAKHEKYIITGWLHYVY